MLSDTERQLLKDRILLQSRELSPEPAGEEPLLQPLKGIRYLIFDFYGTLFISGVGDIGIDEKAGDSKKMVLALAACGLPAGGTAGKHGLKLFNDTVTKHRKALAEDGLEEPEPAIEKVWLDVLNGLAKKGLIDGHRVDEVLARRLAVEFEVRMNPVWPMPDLIPAVEDLRKKSLVMGVISNSQFYTPIAFEALAKQSLEEIGFDRKLLHWSFKEKVKKPSLDFYRSFLDKLKKFDPAAEPYEVLYVGNDMLKDVWPAATLGMRTALFAGDRRSLKWRRDDERCRYLQPDLVITELYQLVKCL